jgi:hypothetical protein
MAKHVDKMPKFEICECGGSNCDESFALNLVNTFSKELLMLWSRSEKTREPEPGDSFPQTKKICTNVLEHVKEKRRQVDELQKHVNELKTLKKGTDNEAAFKLKSAEEENCKQLQTELSPVKKECETLQENFHKVVEEHDSMKKWQKKRTTSSNKKRKWKPNSKESVLKERRKIRKSTNF